MHEYQDEAKAEPLLINRQEKQKGQGDENVLGEADADESFSRIEILQEVVTLVPVEGEQQLGDNERDEVARPAGVAT